MSEAKLSLRVLPSVGEIPAAAWDALLDEDSSPFVEHRWLDMLEQTGCVGEGTGWLPAHLSMWRGDTLVAVAPSYVKGNSEGEFVFDWNWAEAAERAGIRYYPKIVVAVPFTPATGTRVLVMPGAERLETTRIMAVAAREWCGRLGASSVHVLFPREDETRAWESAEYARRDGYQFHWFRDGASHFDDYLARFSSKHRNQIKRERRGVEDAGIIICTLAPEEHTRELALQMHALYGKTIDKHGIWGRLYLTERFFESVVERFRDRLAWVVARDAKTGRVVAGAFNVVHRQRLYGRYWGARVDVPYLHFAVCYYEGIAYCLKHGLDVFEPGAGGEHKRARGFLPTLTHSAHYLADPRLRAALGPWLQHERARVQEIVAGGV